jgi:hypothetical protein
VSMATADLHPALDRDALLYKALCRRRCRDIRSRMS